MDGISISFINSTLLPKYSKYHFPNFDTDNELELWKSWRDGQPSQENRMVNFPAEYIPWLKQELKKLDQLIMDYINKRNINPGIEWIYEGKLEELINQQEKYRRALAMLKKPHNITSGNPGNTIGPQDIVRAKAVLLQTLTETTRGGAGRLTAICPSHADKKPSMVIYLNSNTWHCFVCEAGSDSIDYICKKQNLKFLEAVKYLINL